MVTNGGWRDSSGSLQQLTTVHMRAHTHTNSVKLPKTQKLTVILSPHSNSSAMTKPVFFFNITPCSANGNFI